MQPLTAAEMHDRIGTESVSEWVTVSQEMIDRFADATGDHQFIHVDPVAAAATPFGGTVAHGFLTLSLLPMLVHRTPDMPRLAGARMTVNYGCERLRFVAPVPSGTRVRARFRLTGLTEKQPGRWQLVHHVTVEMENAEKPALAADWIGLVVT